ncbi:RNA-binding protein [Streptococcus didelphis]|uniref:RNA-binding protein n=1 Tax=Streptococcus didelphis TaxID=102886 RepID=A0ABY9LGR0_9STRE|nr:RNA-binding protein [Streptococcus didelphis]WMB28059.1 RNA-binding protein [Streptococcus didelphis]WMB29972.1 RNA-binding protein [Streptococcus didelphis]
MAEHTNIYQHFHPDEYSFIEKMSDFVERVENNYALQVTDFLNPRQMEILKVLVATSKLQYFSSADFYHTEYGRVIIAPDYYSLNQDDFDLALVEISYNSKFNRISHSQILGTLLNELGIKRSLLGDILVQEGYAQIMISCNLLSYFLGNITKIARASVQLREIPLSKIALSETQENTIDITLSSLRLDRVMASVLKLSRSQAIKLLESDKVKVNYGTVRRTSDSLSIGDLVSVRGFGRFKLLEDNGFTKNGKYKLKFSKMMHK